MPCRINAEVFVQYSHFAKSHKKKPPKAKKARKKKDIDMLNMLHTVPINTGNIIPPIPQPALMTPAAPALASGKRPVACATSVDQIGP